MFKTAASRLRALKGRISAFNRGVARFSSLNDVATKPSSSSSPFRGINLPPALPDHVQPVDVKITTLPNGVKLVSLRSEETHCDLAFKLPGGWHNERGAMTLNILQLESGNESSLMKALMGGGESFQPVDLEKGCTHVYNFIRFWHSVASTTILAFLESKLPIVQIFFATAIGRQILTYSDWKLSRLLKAVDEVSLKDIPSIG